MRRGTASPVNGCRWCGEPDLFHVLSWVASKGWHNWHPPTDAQRMARLKWHRINQPTIGDVLGAR